MKNELTNSITDTNEPVNNGNIFTKEFFFHETKYYQLSIIQGKLVFTQRTLNQIYDILGISDNEKEKEIFRLGLHNERKINISKLKINYVFTINPPNEKYIVDIPNYRITVFVGTTLKNEIQDNELWENYLFDRVGEYKEYIKNWLSAFVFLSDHRHKNKTKNKRLPILILIGDRSTGKTSFIELIGSIFANSYIKISKETYVARFNNWKDNKLVHINESQKMGMVQYNSFKEIMGFPTVTIEEKGKERIEVENNISMVIDSNERNPIYTKFAELPNDESENQFFVTTFPKLKEKNDKIVQQLEKSLFHYIDTVLRDVFENEVVPTIDYNTWVIPTPITKEEREMFHINKTQLEHTLETVCDYLQTEYIDKGKTFIPNWDIEELATKVNSKSVTTLKNDLTGNGIIEIDSTTKGINGKKYRGYYILVENVKSMYQKNNHSSLRKYEEDLTDFESEFYDTHKERDIDTDNDILSMVN